MSASITHDISWPNNFMVPVNTVKAVAFITALCQWPASDPERFQAKMSWNSKNGKLPIQRARILCEPTSGVLSCLLPGPGYLRHITRHSCKGRTLAMSLVLATAKTHSHQNTWVKLWLWLWLRLWHGDDKECHHSHVTSYTRSTWGVSTKAVSGSSPAADLQLSHCVLRFLHRSPTFQRLPALQRQGVELWGLTHSLKKPWPYRFALLPLSKSFSPTSPEPWPRGLGGCTLCAPPQPQSPHWPGTELHCEFPWPGG